MRRLAFLAAVALAPAAARAQEVVGRLPENSVIVALHDGQRIGPFAGWLTTGLDPVGVRVKSAPIAGVRYDVAVSNGFYFTMRAFGVRSAHDVLVPTAQAASRRQGTASTNLLGFESGFEFALTGERSWRGLQPLVNAGLGLMTGAFNHFDKGGYAPGSSVLYTYGLAMRFPTGRNGELRADLGWLVHQMRYPSAFRTASAGDDAPLRATGTMTPLTTNRAMTVGWTWGVFR